MKKHIQSYYRTERISSAFLSGVGASAATVGLGYYFWKPSPISEGLMLGLCLVGTYQIIVGIVRIFRSRTRFKNGLDDLINQTGYLEKQEFSRLIKKEKTIKSVRYLELGTLISCILILSLFLFIPYTKALLGTLLGLTFHSAFLFSFDLFSQFRLQEYIHQVDKYLRN